MSAPPRSSRSSSGGTSSAARSTRSSSMLDREVRKVFEDGQLYFGKVVGYDSGVGWYKVLYDDGQHEEYSEAELRPLLGGGGAAAAPAASSSKRPAATTSTAAPKRRRKATADDELRVVVPAVEIDVRSTTSTVTVSLKKDMVNRLRSEWAGRAHALDSRFLGDCSLAKRNADPELVETMRGTTYYGMRAANFHSIYYVYSMLDLLRPGVRRPQYVDKLTTDQAERLVYATVLFRMVNRAATFARFAEHLPTITESERTSTTAWATALAADDSAAVGRINRGDARKGTEAGALPLPGAVRPEDGQAFVVYLEAAKSSAYKVFTGEHQPASVSTITCNVKALEDGALKLLTTRLRAAPDAYSAMTIIGELQGVGDFFAWQIYNDLVNPYHHLWGGTKARIRHDAGRLTDGLCGPGARTGAVMLQRGAGQGSAQEQAVHVARALVKLGPPPELAAAFRESACSVVPPPPGMPKEHATAAWDFEFIEDRLCGVGAAASRSGERWTPNPVTDLLWARVYGRAEGGGGSGGGAAAASSS